MGKTVLGILLIAIGLSYILEINLWQYLWPALLILGGVYILMGRPGHWDHQKDWTHKKHPPRWQEGKVEESSESNLNISAVLQGVDRRIRTDDFKGGHVSAALGGVNLDLRDAKIKSKDPVRLDIEATLGGIKIFVPSTWEVENNISGFAGGVHDSTNHPSEKDKTATLRFFGQASLGGVEITN